MDECEHVHVHNAPDPEWVALSVQYQDGASMVSEAGHMIMRKRRTRTPFVVGLSALLAGVIVSQ